MTAVTNRRAILFGAIAAGAYYLLLTAITPRLPFAIIPAGWRHMWPSGLSSSLSWFGLLDLAAAVLSALPVVACLIWALGRGGLRVGLAVGILVGLGILCEALLIYSNTPRVVAAAVISMLAHAAAIPAVFLLVMSCPLTTRSSGR